MHVNLTWLKRLVKVGMYESGEVKVLVRKEHLRALSSARGTRAAIALDQHTYLAAEKAAMLQACDLVIANIQKGRLR